MTERREHSLERAEFYDITDQLKSKSMKKGDILELWRTCHDERDDEDKAKIALVERTSRRSVSILRVDDGEVYKGRLEILKRGKRYFLDMENPIEEQMSERAYRCAERRAIKAGLL